MTKTNPMKPLYKRLSQVGLSRQFVRDTALPSWWDDEIAENPTGYAQGLLLLSRHLGLDLCSLQNEQAAIRLRDFGTCKFKKRADVSEEQLALARVMATRAAQLAAEAMSTPVGELPANASDIRQQVLGSGAPWVGLPELLDYCWSLGIPVLHVDHFPSKARRPDGFASRVHGRPVIVLCRHEKYSSWLLFILAHELGHIALGHVADDGTLLDDRLNDADQDAEEQQANQFALELLTGDANCRFFNSGRWPNANELASIAQQRGRQTLIEPGHIVLNYGKSMGPDFFAVARAALKVIEPHPNAIKIVRDKLAACLDWSRLPEDSSEFLMRVTREGSPP